MMVIEWMSVITILIARWDVSDSSQHMINHSPNYTFSYVQMSFERSDFSTEEHVSEQRSTSYQPSRISKGFKLIVSWNKNM